MQAPEVVETRRLLLRRPQPADAEAIFERYASDPEVTRFLSWPTHQAVEDTREFLEFSETEWQRWPAGPYVIHSRADNILMGGTGLRFETPHLAETGYVLAKDSWGQGYATEALQAMVAVATRAGVQRLYALCHPEHGASWRVLEKCGFKRAVLERRYTQFPNLPPTAAVEVRCYSTSLERLVPHRARSIDGAGP